MPIIGVSDRESIDPRFKEIGRLRKGSAKNGGRVGRDLDHFRFTSNDPLVLKAFESAYGHEPESLRVYLPYRTMEENFSSWRESYGANELCKMRCDGDYIVDWIAGDRHYHGHRLCTSELKDTENRCPGCPLEPKGRLNVILPALWEAGHFGVVLLVTGSWNDIGHITSKLVQWEPLQGREFILSRHRERIAVPIKGKRAAKEMPLVKIELADEWLMDKLLADRAEARSAWAILPERTGDEPPDDDGFVETTAQEVEPPAEDAEPAEPEEDEPAAQSNGSRSPVSFLTNVLDSVINAGHADSKKAAYDMLNLSAELDRNSPEDIALTWCQHFKGALAAGDNQGDAAKYADLKTFEGLAEAA